ncbi:MAG TPA: efflux RND transporter periplasmic adaptor subunit [Thermoanaerobaculaceae bacterium]|nr:efflux RND transporter periplasmic adaptor subunit [Thermoanaerobaculaceae bacterium]
MNKRLLTLGAGVAAAVSLSACRNGEPAGTIHASGHIEATEVRLAAKIGGRLAELPFQEGDAVKAGDTVARLEAVDLQNELARATAELAVADARLALLEAGTRREDLDRVAAEAARIEAELDAARVDQRRLEGLADRGTATEKARDDARTRVILLERGLAATRAEVAKAKAGPRPQEIAQARAQRDAAAALAATARQKLADTSVSAPRDGVITQRATEPGEVLAPGSLLAILTDVARPWLTVYVDEPSLSHVRIGDPVTVRVDGRKEAFTGSVALVAKVAEFTPKNVQTPEERAKLVFKVKVSLDNTDGVFKPGMPADAYFGSGVGAQGPGK